MKNKPMCTGCRGNVGECRWSYPIGDPDRAQSKDKGWRCKPKYTFGQPCNNNVMECEDWCTRDTDGSTKACRWSWPTADTAGHDSADGKCRCDMRRQEFTWKAKRNNTNSGQCDRCKSDADPICRFSYPKGDPDKGKSSYALARCTNK